MTALVPRPSSLPPAETQLVVVEASAGTGKTYFLEHRVVDLVLAGAELSQILLVTFTDKAVAELRLRIRDLLDRIARAPDEPVPDVVPEGVWVIDDVARRRLRGAVASFDSAPIFTIHGFCHRVLVEDAFAARRLFEQTQVADEVAFDAAFTSLLRARFARVAPERDLLAAFLETDRTVDRLRAILLGCVRAGHDVRVRRRLDPAAARATFRALHAQLGTEGRRNLVLRALPKNGNERRWIGGWLDAIGAVFARAGESNGRPAFSELVVVRDADPPPTEPDRLARGTSPAHADAPRELDDLFSPFRSAAIPITPPSKPAATTTASRTAPPKSQPGAPRAPGTLDDQLREALRRHAQATATPSSRAELDEQLRAAVRRRAEERIERAGQNVDRIDAPRLAQVIPFPTRGELARRDVGTVDDDVEIPPPAEPPRTTATAEAQTVAPPAAEPPTPTRVATAVARPLGARDDGDGAGDFIDGAPPARILAWLDEIREPAQKLLDYVAESVTMVALEATLREAVAAVSLDEAIAAELLPAIVARIHDDKSEHGQFDYDDMLQLVWRALRGPRADELAQRLRERTPWVMIDEFQDTDPVQWNIFRTVWMHAAAKGLTIVGDPKQAIYGFRGADVATYLAARDELLRADATRIPLDVNRRSTKALVGAVNQILIGNFGMPLLDRAITYDEPVRASGDAVTADARTPVKVFAVQAAGKGQTEAIRAAIARAIGDEIEALRADPFAWTKRGEPQPFALGQVMVLTRTNKDSVEIAAALRSRGLPCALVEPDRLFRTREAAELAAVLAAAAAPRDRSARLRALRSRFFDVPWADLMHVVDAPDHHPLVARIFDWAQLASRRTYETLFRKIIEDSRYAERALVLGGGERAITNTWHLVELLLAEVARSRCDLHELVVQLRRWIADDTSQPDERDLQRAETDADAIRVLTIHKAKGLEAPYVFLFGGMSGGPKVDVRTLREATGRVLVVGNHDPATREALDGEADAENQRLAYVALTRAQVRLYVPLYGELPKSAAYLPIQRCLQPLVARAVRRPTSSPRIMPPSPAASSPQIVPSSGSSQIGSAAPTSGSSPIASDPVRGALFGEPAELFEVMQLIIGKAAPAAAPPDALAAFVAPPPPEPVELAALPDERSGLAMLSYTRLARDLDAVALAVRPGDAVALDPAEFDIDAPTGDEPDAEPVELGPDELPAGASSGLLLHDVLEVADLDTVRRAPDAFAWAREADVAAQLTDAARARGVAPSYLPHARDLAYGTLTRPLELPDGTVLPPLAAARSLAREVEFAYPIPERSGATAMTAPRGLVKGYIDALVAWDDDLWVVDYKSDVLGGDPKTTAARRVREHYAIQARLYAIAAERMRGRRRLAGLLFLFVRYHLAFPVLATDRIPAWTAWLADLPAERSDALRTMSPAASVGRPVLGSSPAAPASPRRDVRTQEDA